MDNKEIFRHAQDIARALKLQCPEIKVTTAKQVIYDGISRLIKSTQHNTLYTDKQNKQKNGEGLDTSSLPSDDELRAQLKVHLINRLAAGTLQAAEIGQLKDVFGLANAEIDLEIVVTDYANTIIECPHCGESVHKVPLDSETQPK